MSDRLVGIGLLLCYKRLRSRLRSGLKKLHPGEHPPRIAKKVEPKSSSAGLAHHIQGTVLVHLVIAADGTPANLEVIRPLGYGLDENAINAIQEWRFHPATRGAKSVPYSGTVAVNFQLLGRSKDKGLEKRRASYDAAAKLPSGGSSQEQSQAVVTLQQLAKEGFPAALYAVGMWEIKGTNVEKNETCGLQKIERAAKEDFGPAIFQRIAHSMLGSAITAEGWEAIRRAAMLGSVDAQFFLGDRHERGEGTEKSADRSKNYFRLCASQGVAACQFRLARPMFSADRRDFEYEQALAWFSLAADQGNSEVRQIVEAETSKLDAAQARRVETLQKQFSSALN